MYRAPQESFARTLERLEAEVVELRTALRPRRAREAAFAAVTVTSLVAALVGGAASWVSRTRAHELEQRYDALAPRFEHKIRDLDACEDLAESRTRALQQCRVDLWEHRGVD